jgi:hypothetical protein
MKKKIVRPKERESSGQSDFLTKLRLRLHPEAEQAALRERLRAMREQHERARSGKRAKRAARITPAKHPGKRQPKKAPITHIGPIGTRANQKKKVA